MLAGHQGGGGQCSHTSHSVFRATSPACHNQYMSAARLDVASACPRKAYSGGHARLLICHNPGILARSHTSSGAWWD